MMEMVRTLVMLGSQMDEASSSWQQLGQDTLLEIGHDPANQFVKTGMVINRAM